MAGDYCTTGRLSIRPKENGAWYNSWRRDETTVEPERIFQTQPVVYLHGRSRRRFDNSHLWRGQFHVGQRLPPRGVHMAVLASDRRAYICGGQRNRETQALQRER